MASSSFDVSFPFPLQVHNDLLPLSGWGVPRCVLKVKLRQDSSWWKWVLLVPWCHPDPSSPSWPLVIEEANWMTLDKDVPRPPEGGFDAVICLGNSFAHLPDCKGERCGLGNGLL